MIDRRYFLKQLGRSTLAIAVVGVAACAGDTSSSTSAGSSAMPESSTTEPADAGSTTSTATSTTTPVSAAALTWERVNLGFVSAYILVRGDEAAIVDTGVAGSADAILGALENVGLDWAHVGHVIATHLHGDHVGSFADVMNAAEAAAGYAGAADIPGITSPRAIVAVGDGDTVFGMNIVDTPGHTPGHISVHDPEGSVLVAGDAINGDAGDVTGPNPQFSPDLAGANASMKKLAALEFEVILFGHGDPVTDDAKAKLAALAASV